MGHHPSKVLIGAVLLACAGILGSVAQDTGKSALSLGLSPVDAAPGHLPAAIRVVITNRSTHGVTGSNLVLIFYAGSEFYAWGRQRDDIEFELGPGENQVQVLGLSSLVYDGPAGQRRTAAAVATRLRRSRWTVRASAEYGSVQGSVAGTVWSNELEFSAESARQAKQ